MTKSTNKKEVGGKTVGLFFVRSQLLAFSLTRKQPLRPAHNNRLTRRHKGTKGTKGNKGRERKRKKSKSKPSEKAVSYQTSAKKRSQERSPFLPAPQTSQEQRSAIGSQLSAKSENRIR